MKDDEARHFGKYRGTVVNTIDPELRARLQAIVPDVFGTQPTTWAMPAAPYAGLKAGFVALPPVGAGVWIEFEGGDPDFPIWSGGWWGSAAELPDPLVQPGFNQITLVTPGKHAVVISDIPGPANGVSLRTNSGARITVSDTGIVIDNGQDARITVGDTGIVIDNGQGASITLTGNKVHITGVMV